MCSARPESKFAHSLARGPTHLRIEGLLSPAQTVSSPGRARGVVVRCVRHAKPTHSGPEVLSYAFINVFEIRVREKLTFHR